MKNWISHPDDVDRVVLRWQQEYNDLLYVESIKQYSGRPLWILTVTDFATPLENKKKAAFFKPHAHEPAPLAAMMNIVCQLLTGYTLAGEPTALARERYLQEALLCFIPDGNPTGTAAAPVIAWDGTQYTNEEFWAWMCGVDPDTGKRWKWVEYWDDSQEPRRPLRYGIVYEQVSAHEYVEPYRHPRSSLLRALGRLCEQYHWDRWLDMHQTEFGGSERNCLMILPPGIQEQSAEQQQIERSLVEAILQAWARTPGARPVMKVEPFPYTGEPLTYFLQVWRPFRHRCNLVTSEVQNNSVLTPPPVQQRLNEVAIVATIEHLWQEM